MPLGVLSQQRLDEPASTVVCFPYRLCEWNLSAARVSTVRVPFTILQLIQFCWEFVVLSRFLFVHLHVERTVPQVVCTNLVRKALEMKTKANYHWERLCMCSTSHTRALRYQQVLSLGSEVKKANVKLSVYLLSMRSADASPRESEGAIPLAS